MTDSPSWGITTVVMEGAVSARTAACQTGVKAFRTRQCTGAGTAPRSRDRAGKATALDGGARRRGRKPAAHPPRQPLSPPGAAALAGAIAVLAGAFEVALRIPGLRRAGVDLRLRGHRLVPVAAAGERPGRGRHYGARRAARRAVPGEQDAADGRARRRRPLPR